MKILFISTGHCIEDSRVTRKEAVALAKYGHQVTVCARWAGKEYYNDNLTLVDVVSLTQVKRGMALHPVDIGRIKRVALSWNLFKLAKCTKPDLIVAHEFETAVLALIIRKILRISFVFDVHEGYERNIPLIFPRFMRPFMQVGVDFLMRCIVRSSAGITACTMGVYPYRYATQTGHLRDLVYNSPPIAKFRYSDSDNLTMTICHEGYVSEDRGPMQMIEAFRILKKTHNFKVKFFGEFESSILKQFKDKIKLYGLEEFIDLVGYLDFDKLGEAESACQVGLIVGNDGYNYRLALPNKIFSYMACGMAVLGPKFGQMEELIKEANCGRVANPKDPKEIADELAWLIEHPDERRAMARNGRKAMEEKYSWERMEDVMRTFYEKIEKKICK